MISIPIQSQSNTKCLTSNQYTLDNLINLCKLTDKIKQLSQSKKGLLHLKSLLSHKRAILYFKQPSTRTFLSFNNACHILGMYTSDVRDISTSSETKGESDFDTIKTFAQYSDLIIMRHPSNNFIYDCVYELVYSNLSDVRIINAGSGSNEHPTQALLDFYTMYKYGLLEGKKKIAFVGDLLRSRAVRSLILLLNKINNKNIELYFISPKAFRIKLDILQQLNMNYLETEHFEKRIQEADMIYMVRLQDEYKDEMISVNEIIDTSRYSINNDNINKLKENAIILHPLPRREEISINIDRDKRAKYWEQTNNGMYVRVALICDMFGIGINDLD